MLAKLNQAKAYKKEKAAKPEVTPEIVPVQSTSTANKTQQPQDKDPQRKDAFSASQRAEKTGQPEESDSDPGPVTHNGGQGSAGQAAGYLQQAIKAADSTKGMRMETYSMLKEQEKRSQKVAEQLYICVPRSL